MKIEFAPNTRSQEFIADDRTDVLVGFPGKSKASLEDQLKVTAAMKLVENLTLKQLEELLDTDRDVQKV